MRFLIVLVLALFTGCSSLTYDQEREISRWMLPINIAGGYFGTVAWHEAGHAFTAEGIGGKGTKVYILPKKDDDGVTHLGLTTTKLKDPSNLDITLYNTMGPTAAFLAHTGTRGLLRSGALPRVIQPTVAWFSVCNQLSYYGQVIAGIARIDTTDLGKEDPWISWVMLAGGLTFDVIDFLTDEPDRYFGVLFGEEFYGEENKMKMSFSAAPVRGGGILAFRLEW